MTATIVKKSSYTLNDPEGPSLKVPNPIYDCAAGGYSVWDCPPLFDPKLPAQAKKAS